MTPLESFDFAVLSASLLVGGMVLVSWGHWKAGLFFMFCSAVIITAAQALWKREAGKV